MTRRSPEKSEEHDGDELMEMLGFTSIHFSQARASRQTPGIPDRLYFRPSRSRSAAPVAFKVWWEAKAPKGRQSAAQRSFQALAESCGDTVVVGPVSALVDWCRRMGLIK